MTIIHGFELLKDEDIPELKTRARFLRHVKTGAELLSLENEDENKVFGITFRTPPQDATGLTHIMEHSVLCGSQKYPVKEPFVELVKGSLNTFLNAFTYPDKTCYPVASQNLKDLYNLIDVYIDAVFHPLITPQTLQQEGWHYELDGPESPINYKGVVFNEMKGAYSDPDGRLQTYVQHSLYPDTVYSLDSGGDPRKIPDLTYDQFKAYHDTYYHPSNARIFFYGDDSPDERLARMEAYLQGYEHIQVSSAIQLQPKFDQPRKFSFAYDMADESQEQGTAKKSMLTVNWMLPEASDSETTLALKILNHVLIGTPASPLRKALIDSGLGEDLAGSGFQDELRQYSFSTGLKGIASGDADKVESLILQTLETLVREGIDPGMIAASLNTVEFALRENNTGSFPRGLALMLWALATWLHDDDPLKPLAFECPLASIRRMSAGGNYFEGLIREFFLQNTHRTTVLLEPDSDLRRREDEAERERLDKARTVMTPADLQAIIAETQALKLRQETPDTQAALATIPNLSLSDLDKKNKLIPLEVMEQNDVRLLYHDLFTNGILYLDLGFDLHSLPQEYLPYLTLFSRALLETGTEKEDFVKLSQHIGRETGGIHPAVFASTIRQTDKSTTWLFLRGKATTNKSEELLRILSEVLRTARLDNRERFRQILLEEKADQEARLVPGGHRVVNTRLRALFDEADWVNEQIGGASYLYFLRQCVDGFEKDWPAILEKLEAMRKILLNRRHMLCNVTLDGENWRAFRPHLDEFLNELPYAPSTPAVWMPQREADYEALTIPAQVNYVGKGANLYQLGYKMSGSYMPILKYLAATWLWERVRVRGGAYGGFCLFDHRSGVFTFLSYRDPNLLETLDNYDGAAQFLQELDDSRLDSKELTKSIIGAIGDMDAYQLPDAKGYTSMLRYLAGDTNESRQKMRDEVLTTSLGEFQALGQVLEKIRTKGKVVVVGSQEAIQAANASRENWMKVQKLL